MVPVVSAVPALRGLPPVLVEYHWMPVPVAARLATVPLLQNAWVAVPVGAAGAVMVAVTAKRVADSQLLRVWVA